MKIRNLLHLSFIAIICGFAILGTIEHRHIANLADSFGALESRRAPSLTALLELLTATRRASVKSMEYSLRGKPSDRVKAREALQQIDREFENFIALNPGDQIPADNDLAARKARFADTIETYLQISEGPVIDEVLAGQDELHAARSAVIRAVNDILPRDTSRSSFELLTIKSEARKVSVKVMEYVLRGRVKDREKALQAMDELRAAQRRYTSITPSAPQAAQAINARLEKYLSTAKQFLQLTSPGRHSVEDLYAHEQDVHEARKLLVKSLYPLIAFHYEDLHRAAATTSDQIEQADRLQTYSVAVMAVFALLAGMLLARSISDPLTHLSTLVSRFGRGESISPGDVPASGALELVDLGNAFTDMMREREALDHALKERERYLSMLFDTSPVGLALTRMDGSLVEVNPAFAAITGRSVEETLDTTDRDITPLEYRSQEEEQLTSLKTIGRYGPYEKEYLHKDGHRVPVRLNGRMIERDGQHFVWSAVENISASRDLQALSDRLHNILDQSFDEIYIFDGITLRFVQVSSGALENLGYSMDEMRAMTPTDLKPDFTDASFANLIEPLRTGDKQLLVFETRHRRKDGSHYPVEIRLQISREAEPKFFAIVLDLTERKRNETELELHRQNLERLMEQRTATVRQQAQIIAQTHDSIVTTNLDGVITSWNGGAENLFGIPATRALGKHISFVYPEHQQTYLQDQVIAPLKAKGKHETEVWMRRTDGSEFPAHLSLSLLYGDDGVPTGMIGYSIDISELKRREAELALLTDRLQTSNKELESFAYSVSHDLRAPLRAIDGFSLALTEDYSDRLDGTALDYLQRVRGAAQRMGLLIDDLLQLSRVNRSELKLEEVDLSDIARSVLDELEAGEPGRHVELTLDHDMRAQGDARLLRVMLDNLLGNAWKFSSREAVSRIDFGRMDGDPGTFYVRDNGVGFDMRYADKLFGAFQRLHGAGEFPGTGVGLATAQRIVHRHGGKIWADAREGEGATFYFALERAETSRTTAISQQGEQ